MLRRRDRPSDPNVRAPPAVLHAVESPPVALRNRRGRQPRGVDLNTGSCELSGDTIGTLTLAVDLIRNEPEFKAIFGDIERDMAAQPARLAARPKDAPLSALANGYKRGPSQATWFEPIEPRRILDQDGMTKR